MMDEKTITEAVLRYFRRYWCDYGCMWHPEPTSRRRRRPDLLFLQTRSNLLHIIEAEPTLSRAFDKRHGFAQLKKYKGNYKWLAIPKQEWKINEEDDLEKGCKSNGIGLLTVSGTARFHVTEEVQPRYIEGYFLEYYPDAEYEWYEE